MSLETDAAPHFPTPSVTPIPTPGDGASDVVERFLDAYRQALSQNLPSFDGHTLVRYRWRHANGQRGGLSVRLIQVTKEARVNAIPKMELEFKGDDGQVVTLEDVFLSPTLKEDEAWVRLCMPDEEGNAKAIKEVKLAEDVPAAEAARETRLARPQVPSSDRFGEAFFGTAPPTDLTIEREIDTAIAEFWPVFDAEHNDKWKLQLPAREPLDARSWTAASLAFLAWGLLASLQGARERHLLTRRFVRLRQTALPSDDLYGVTAAAPVPAAPPPRHAEPGVTPVNEPAPAPLEPTARQVDLSAQQIREELEARKPPIYLPWHVLEAACTSLNSGKHVILTGPPGCGKTELAVTLARAITGTEGLMATASPAWTTGDTIGRYFPTLDGDTLEFRPGFFLRAIEDRRCLIIDEFNRARIDDCFGELFTVLSGQNVELPYESQENGARRRVRLVVNAETAGPPGDRFKDYSVPASFRLLGTMNDADRAELAQLSYALLRRVDIIRVEAPEPGVLRKVLRRVLDAQMERAELQSTGYLFRLRGAGTEETAAELLEASIDNAPEAASAEAEAGTTQSGVAFQLLTELVGYRLIGVATAIDVLRFVVEGMRSGSARNVCLVEDRNQPRYLVLSYLSMAIALKVFPQLDSVDWDRREEIIGKMVESFARQNGPFLRIEPAASNDPALDYHFRVRAGLREDEKRAVADTVVEFLVAELRRQYHLERRGRASFLDKLAEAAQ